MSESNHKQPASKTARRSDKTVISEGVAKEANTSDTSEVSPRSSSRMRRLAEDAFRVAWKTGIVSLSKASKLVQSPENLRLLAETGESLRDMREIAGLTRNELAEALDLSDKSLIEAVEEGTATLSFELILRLAALLARHDPVPFVLKYAKAYNPEIWRMLESWGPARVTTQYERERQFINIMRGHDAVRNLSDEGFAEVLKFTRSAFEMALHFVAEKENIEDHVVEPDQTDDRN